MRGSTLCGTSVRNHAMVGFCAYFRYENGERLEKGRIHKHRSISAPLPDEGVARPSVDINARSVCPLPCEGQGWGGVGTREIDEARIYHWNRVRRLGALTRRIVNLIPAEKFAALQKS